VKASCHCGAVVLEVTLSNGLETAGRCDCSFCRRRGAPAVTASKNGVRIVRGAEHLTTYQWGTRTARHHFCKVCGIYMYHNRRSNPKEIGVNMGTLEGVNPADHEPMEWHDGVNHPSDARQDAKSDQH